MDGVVLHLVPVTDPLAGPGYPPRDADLRLRLALKQLLRQYGLRCRRICDAAKVAIVSRQPAARAGAPSHDLASGRVLRPPRGSDATAGQFGAAEAGAAQPAELTSPAPEGQPW